MLISFVNSTWKHSCFSREYSTWNGNISRTPDILDQDQVLGEISPLQALALKPWFTKGWHRIRPHMFLF
jgi:hypothetical protein